MNRSTVLVIALLLETVLGTASGRQARAQLSPGELSAAHAELEGSRSCLQCHEARRGVDPERCLACHRLLADSVRAGRGLHARDEYRACETCHIDHQGRDFALVWWGDEGLEAFDHTLTGWRLDGRHRTDDCRTCHRRDRIDRPRPLLDAGKDLDRTFLGLDAACTSCHADPHRGQFEGASCDTCHDVERFAPASAFEHDATRFALDGAHANVACEGCHAALSAPQSPDAATPGDDLDTSRGARRYRGIDSTSCSSCHRDPHGSRLGPRCADCHETARWSSARTAGFDHRATAYPLEQRHAAVACDACHGPSFARPRPASEACTDCHADPHLGQLEDAGRCETCHDVAGFRPSRYTTDEHAASRFPLDGRHAEQPCASCHLELPIAEARTALRLAADSAIPESSTRVRRFRFDSTLCAACHDDPHAGTTAAAGGGCGACHDAWGWHGVAFAHRNVGYPLVDGHRGLECTACHRRSGHEAEPDATVAAPLRFDGLGTECAACHDDPHAGQLASTSTSGANETRCERCHADGRFRPSIFDHQLDSRYPLAGAHRSVPCAGCHPATEEDGVSTVLYRPRPLECSGCHSEPPPPLGEGG